MVRPNKTGHSENSKRACGCSKFEIQAFRVKNSLFLEKLFLIRVRKFPVPLRREFSSKSLNSLADGTPKSHWGGRILQNSLFFSLLAGNLRWRPTP